MTQHDLHGRNEPAGSDGRYKQPPRTRLYCDKRGWYNVASAELNEGPPSSPEGCLLRVGDITCIGHIARGTIDRQGRLMGCGETQYGL